MPHDEPQPRSNNPFAYHAAQGDSPDETPRKKTPVTSEEADMFREAALLMLFPVLLTSLLLMLGMFHFIIDGDAAEEETFLEFIGYAAFDIIPMFGIPWLITVCVAAGLFFEKHWAVNVGLIYSFLPTLISVWFLLLFQEIFAFLPLLGCIAYNILFIRAKCLLLANRRHAEEKEEETDFQA